MRRGLVGAGRIGAFHAATLAIVSGSCHNARGCEVRPEARSGKDSGFAVMDGWLPLRSVEVRVDFPSAMPYTDFMERFRQACVDELVALTGLSRRRGRAVRMVEVGGS